MELDWSAAALDSAAHSDAGLSTPPRHVNYAALINDMLFVDKEHGSKQPHKTPGK